MKVKIIDCEHEEDLEEAINSFLKEDIILKDIKYQACHFTNNGEQIYSFSALIIYE
ncbi:MAG: sporulation protein Cse60 [Acholeplasmatales bacterium]|nr:sporulation protein Cse60 [Acholeplasmatales bacterium]